jgi:hypothetical protein
MNILPWVITYNGMGGDEMLDLADAVESVPTGWRRPAARLGLQELAEAFFAVPSEGVWM